MPLPVVHSYAGYSLYKFSLPSSEPKRRRWALLFMALANLPDLDYIPGMLLGTPELFHRHFTHSFAFSLLCAVLVAGLFRLFKKTSFFRMFLVSGSVCFSHLALDYMTGVLKSLFWPFPINLQPAPIAQFFQQLHDRPEGSMLRELCASFVSQDLLFRLLAETVLVGVLLGAQRLVSKSGVAKRQVSESPAFLWSLGIFLIVLTALAVKEVSG